VRLMTSKHGSSNSNRSRRRSNPPDEGSLSRVGQVFAAHQNVRISR
jgi:hypothetical protein